MGQRITWNASLAWSLAALGALVLLLVLLVTPVLQVVFAPRADAQSVSDEFARLLGEHDEAVENYTARFDGRSAFFKPAQPRPARVERPRRDPAPKTEEREPVNVEPKRPPYGGPSIRAFVGEALWFDNGDRVRVGEEKAGLRVLSSDMPRSARVEYGGWEYDVEFRPEQNNLLSAASDSPSTARGSGMPGLFEADEDSAEAARVVAKRRAEAAATAGPAGYEPPDPSADRSADRREKGAELRRSRGPPPAERVTTVTRPRPSGSTNERTLPNRGERPMLLPAPRRLIPERCTRTLLTLALLVGVAVPPAFGQDGAEGTDDQERETVDDAAGDAAEAPAEEDVLPGRYGRRGVRAGKVTFAWDDISVPETLGWIAEATGKVVMPVNLIALKNKKISLQTESPIERGLALDMLFRAFRLNNVGVIEKDDVVIIGVIDEIMLVRQMPVIPAAESIMNRTDRASLVVKIFQLEEVPAEDLEDQLAEGLPNYASLKVDANSNQIVVMGDIALCQHLSRLIEELDHRYVEPKTQTFRLAYADAVEVSEQILELFDTSSTAGGSNQRRQTGGRSSQRGQQPPRTSGAPLGPAIELRVTVSTQQNSVTVSAEPTIVNEVTRLIESEWDLPRSPGTSRIYTLHYTDPLKVAEKLNSLLSGGSSGGGGGGARRTTRAGGSGGSTGVEQILQGIYSIEAYPDTSQLLVFCKTEQSLDFLDQVIADLDQPTSIGLPFVIELKHANSIELAEELNALLSESGMGATLERPESGLSGRQDSEGTTTGGAGGVTEGGTLNFPWQRGGGRRDDQSPESALIGKVRIVPIVRQNALAVLCPIPQAEAVRELIEYFDRPGRQVMISAIIAEVELTDDLNLGIRLSNSDEILGGSNPDFRLGSSMDVTGNSENVLPNLFDTSILDAAIPVNIVIQALQQNTNVRILQEPVIFTADNQEALFFDGQDIPFITSTVINNQGNPTDSFDYREVGVTLNVRPRITVHKDVDLEILLELSSIVPGVTLFGGAVIDRRETRTHVVVTDGQTILISGILREEESKITRKVPLLGDIPILGELFKSRENTTKTTELIAFITPHVVDNPEENETNYNAGARERLRELTYPVDEQLRDRNENPDKYRRMFLPAELKDPLDPDKDFTIPEKYEEEQRKKAEGGG